MGSGSQSREVGEAYDRAEETIRRRTRDGCTFMSAQAACGWYFERRQAMQSPNTLHPRGETVKGGEVVYVQVDGGKGGDLDEVLSTISTIGGVLHDLHIDLPRPYAVLVAYLRDGKSQKDIAKDGNVSQGTASADLGKALAYVAGALRRAKVLT